MAVKKQPKGESKAGLVITLVFFILATIGLGVATYYGFKEQADLEGKLKKANDAEKLFKTERDWYRFQAHLYRAYMGETPQGLDMAELTRNKEGLEKGQFGTGQKDRDDVVALVNKAEFKTYMPWVGDQPKSNFQRRLKDKDDQYASLEKANNQLKEELETEKKKAERAEDSFRSAKAGYDKALVELDKKVDKLRTTDRTAIDTLTKEALAQSKGKEDERRLRDEAEKKLLTAQRAQTRLTGELTGLKRDNKDLKDQLQEMNARLKEIYERTGLDPKAVAAATLDARALEALKNWKKDWKVVMIDRTGTSPYINLGSTDKVVPQLTFSIHSAGLDGKLAQTPKGTLEVIQVIGPHLSRVKITSVKDAKNDPIVKGDRLFNPTWDPGRKKHVAFVGLIDLYGDGRDASAEFHRMLKRQGIEIDSHMDMKDLSMKGKGISIHTDYVIIGDSLDGSSDPRARDRDANKRVEDTIKAVKAKGFSEGAAVISLGKYLDMIGYRPLRGTKESPRGGGYR
jgi:hypothetical protein